MRELPKNPNTRQPYSDVNMELVYYTGEIVEYLGMAREKMGEDEWKRLDMKLKALGRAMLRARAVLDPLSLTDQEWETANQDAFALMIELQKQNEQ